MLPESQSLSGHTRMCDASCPDYAAQNHDIISEMLLVL